PHRRPGQDRGRPARPRARRRAAGEHGRDPVPRARGDRGAAHRHRAAVRHLLRAGRVGADGRADPQARDADRGQRQRRVVVHPPRRRRGRYRRGRGAGQRGPVQRRRRRPGAGGGVAAAPGRRGRREAAAARAGVARAAAGRGGRRALDDRGPRRVQREGEARAGLAAALEQLARRVPARADRRGGCRPVTEPDEEPQALRPLLFSIAYRMLGSVSDAEDVVQEAYLRHQRALADGTRVESTRAYLSAVTTRLAIDHLRSARVRRESYVGQWLPEPLLTDGGEDDPAAHAEQSDSLSMAFLLVLERLNPVERAVFLLHDVFGYGYDE